MSIEILDSNNPGPLVQYKKGNLYTYVHCLDKENILKSKGWVQISDFHNHGQRYVHIMKVRYNGSIKYMMKPTNTRSQLDGLTDF